MTLGDGMGRDMEGGLWMGAHVCLWLIHVNVWQKPLQYCKVISLQLNNFFFLKGQDKLRSLDTSAGTHRVAHGERCRLQCCGSQSYLTDASCRTSVSAPGGGELNSLILSPPSVIPCRTRCCSASPRVCSSHFKAFGSQNDAIGIFTQFHRDGRIFSEPWDLSL